MNEILHKIAYNSHRIVSYLFWLYLLIFVFLKKHLPDYSVYILFILLGVYAGYSFAIWSIKYLKRKED